MKIASGDVITRVPVRQPPSQGSLGRWKKDSGLFYKIYFAKWLIKHSFI